jgi:hypothetical protein
MELWITRETFTLNWLPIYYFIFSRKLKIPIFCSINFVCVKKGKTTTRDAFLSHLKRVAIILSNKDDNHLFWM